MSGINNTLNQPSAAWKNFGSTLATKAGSVMPKTKVSSVQGLLSPVQNLSQYGGGVPTFKPPVTSIAKLATPVNTTPQTTNYTAPMGGKGVTTTGATTGGATVTNPNTPKTTPPTAPKPPVVDPSSYKGLVGRVAGAGTANNTQTGIVQDIRNTAAGNQDIGQQAVDISNKYAPEINRVGQLGAGAVAGNLSTGSNVVGAGNANLAANAVSARIQALQNAQASELKGNEQQLTAQNQTATAQNNALTGANTQQQQQITALSNATGYTQPVQVPYSNQYVDPTTGQPMGGGSMGGSLQSAVQSIAQQVQNGTMSYDQGVQALAGYGQGGMNALQQALGGGSFSPLQSNANAAANSAATLQTGTIGGELTKQADTVMEHMLTLKNKYNEIGAQYPIPAVNQTFNWFASKLGGGDLQAYKVALSNVRDELAKVLGGGSATEGTRSTAAGLLPDNMSPAQIDSVITTATELMKAKIEEYTKAPQYGNQQQQSNNYTPGAIIQTSAGAVDPNWFNDNN